MVVNDVETLEFTKMMVNSMRGQLLIKQNQIRAQFYSLAPKVVLARTEFNKADAALTKFINGKADYIQKHSVDEYFSEVQSLFADAYEKNGKLEALKYKAEKIWDALEESKSQQKILSDKVKLIESKLEHE